MSNRLVVVGWMGSRRAYLNIPTDDALRRHIESEGLAMTPEDLKQENLVYEIEFDDEFGVYDAWS